MMFLKQKYNKSEGSRIYKLNQIKRNRTKLSTIAIKKRVRRLYSHLPKPIADEIVKIFMNHINERPHQLINKEL